MSRRGRPRGAPSTSAGSASSAHGRRFFLLQPYGEAIPVGRLLHTSSPSPGPMGYRGQNSHDRQALNVTKVGRANARLPVSDILRLTKNSATARACRKMWHLFFNVTSISDEPTAKGSSSPDQGPERGVGSAIQGTHAIGIKQWLMLTTLFPLNGSKARHRSEALTVVSWGGVPCGTEQGTEMP